MKHNKCRSRQPAQVVAIMNIVKITKQGPEMKAHLEEKHVNMHRRRSKARCEGRSQPDHQVADERHEAHCDDEMFQGRIPSTSL